MRDHRVITWKRKMPSTHCNQINQLEAANGKTNSEADQGAELKVR
jgi:hypothetical protein